MDKYQNIRDDAFKMAHEKLMKEVDREDLLAIVDILKGSPYDSFGLVKKLRQETVSKFFPLVADGLWRVKESYYCSEKSFDIVKREPSFVNIESYNEWRRLKQQYPKGFDRYEGGRQVWMEYEDKYPDFWGDARMLDGHAEFRFGKISIAPSIVKGYHDIKAHDSIQDDELFLIIYDNACREYPEVKCPYHSGCGTLQEHKGEIDTTPGMCFVLTPYIDDFKERKIRLYEYFKSHILSAYLKLVVRKHEEDQANIWKNEYMDKSERLLIEHHIEQKY